MSQRPERGDARNTLPIARWGLGELRAAVVLAAGAVALGAWGGRPWNLLWAPTVLAASSLAWFYRDPPRAPPGADDAYLSPADGRVVAVEPLGEDHGVAGPATRIDIFLSVFDVHITRSPRRGVVQSVQRQPGGYRNALAPKAARINNAVETRFADAAGRHFAVRQVSGLMARRIVADLVAGEEVLAGQKFGMIKFGSRTELILPAGVEVRCRVGDRVRAGETVLAAATHDGP